MLYINACTNGLAIFKSRSSNVWPFGFTILNLPSFIRKQIEYIFPCTTMHFEKGEFNNMLQFLFFSELQYLQTNRKNYIIILNFKSLKLRIVY